MPATFAPLDDLTLTAASEPVPAVTTIGASGATFAPAGAIRIDAASSRAREPFATSTATTLDCARFGADEPERVTAAKAAAPPRQHAPATIETVTPRDQWDHMPPHPSSMPTVTGSADDNLRPR